MEESTLIARVQYGDYVGTTAGDSHDLKHLKDFANKYGVDTNKYFVFGIEMSLLGNSGDNQSSPEFYLLAHDTSESKAGGIDHLNSFLEEGDGVLRYAKLRVNVTFEDLTAYFKRLDVVLHNRHIQAKSFECIERT